MATISALSMRFAPAAAIAAVHFEHILLNT
jgi:hypothetical protein